MEPLDREIVNDVVRGAAGEYLKDSVVLCVCGMCKDINWLLSIQDSQKTNPSEYLRKLEVHLLECLKLKPEEVDSYLEQIVTTPVNFSQIPIDDHLKIGIDSVDKADSTLINYPLKISIDISDSLWKDHLDQLEKHTSFLHINIREDGKIEEGTHIHASQKIAYDTKNSNNTHFKDMFRGSASIYIPDSSNKTPGPETEQLKNDESVDSLSVYNQFQESRTFRSMPENHTKPRGLSQKALIKFLRINLVALQNFKTTLKALKMELGMLQSVNEEEEEQLHNYSSLKQKATHEILAQDLTREIDFYIDLINKELRNSNISGFFVDEAKQDKLNAAMRNISQMLEILKGEALNASNNTKFSSLPNELIFRRPLTASTKSCHDDRSKLKVSTDTNKTDRISMASTTNSEENFEYFV